MEEVIHGHVWIRVMLLVQPVTEGVTNAGALSMGTTKRDIDGPTEGEDGAGVQARGMIDAELEGRVTATPNHLLAYVSCDVVSSE